MSGYRHRCLSYLWFERTWAFLSYFIWKMWWTWIFYSRGSTRRSRQCVIRVKLPQSRRLHRPGRAGSESAWHSQTLVTVTVETCEYVFNSKVKLKSDIFCVVEVLWERHIGSVMFYLLDMAHERRQACPSVVVKGKQWSISEKDHLGYGRALIVYAGSGPPRHSTSTYDGPDGVFTIAIQKNHGQPFYNIPLATSPHSFQKFWIRPWAAMSRLVPTPTW